MMCLTVNVGDCLSQDQGAMMFGGQGSETTQVSIPNNVRTQTLLFTAPATSILEYYAYIVAGTAAL